MRLRLSTPSASFFAPSPALAGVVRGYIVRDTTRVPVLAAAQRVNRYPASGHAALVWLLEGSSARLLDDGRAHEPLPRTALLGPQTRPFVTCNPGPVRSFGVVLAPQALHGLAGLDIALLTDRVLPAEPTLGSGWAALCDTVRAAAGDDERIDHVERFLLQCLHQLPAAACPLPVTPGAAGAGQWLHALAWHAAAAGWGGSRRSLARRVRAWAGLPLRCLQRLARVEQALLDARDEAAARAINPDWADVAARHRFADQPHLCRHTREVTGHSPRELAHGSERDESFWFYRVWSTREPDGSA